MLFRQFEDADADSVIGLANTYARFDSPITAADLQVTTSFPEAFIIAEEKEKIIGFVFGYIREIPSQVLEHWGASKVGQIELLAVDPHFRKRGVGTKLLSSLLDIFTKNGVDMVTLHCPAEANEAKHLYDKMGFETRAFAMKKRLS